MEVQIIKSETYRLTDDQALDVTIKYLEQILYPGDTVRNVDGINMLLSVDHDRYNEEQIRPATDLDIAALKTLRLLRLRQSQPKGPA